MAYQFFLVKQWFCLSLFSQVVILYQGLWLWRLHSYFQLFTHNGSRFKFTLLAYILNQQPNVVAENM